MTFFEEQLIAQVHPVITEYRLTIGEFGFSVQMINFHLDITNFTIFLPHSIHTLKICFWSEEIMLKSINILL